MKKYTDSYEWVHLVDGIATIGITAFAAEEIGEIAFVELPQVGRELCKDEVSCVVESSKAAIDIESPISGKVVSVNESLQLHPELVSKHPETEGWLYRIEPTDPQEI